MSIADRDVGRGHERSEGWVGGWIGQVLGLAGSSKGSWVEEGRDWAFFFGSCILINLDSPY